MQYMHHPSLFVVVPGFGRPHADEKIRILSSNIQLLQSCGAWGKVSVTVCVYDKHVLAAVPDTLLAGATWVVETGVVGQFIRRHASPHATCAYDYVMVLLDDVELQSNIDFESLLQFQRVLGLDIMSPALTLDSKRQFDFMLTQPSHPATLKITTACEAFCYLMPFSAFKRYHAILDGVAADNPWLWGVDMCLYKCFDFRVAIANHMTMRHHFKSEGYSVRPDCDPFLGRATLFESLGVTAEELAAQEAVLCCVI